MGKKGIKIKVDKRGRKKAYYYSRLQMRWMPIKLDEAEILLSTEQAYRVPANTDWA